jgi:hypothetical protein
MHGLGYTFAAIGLAAIGVVGQAVTAVLVAASGADLGPWVSGGSATAAVGGLVYIAKRLASGELVARNVAEIEKRAEERERQMLELMADGRQREDAFRAFLAGRGLH